MREREFRGKVFDENEGVFIGEWMGRVSVGRAVVMGIFEPKFGSCKYLIWFLGFSIYGKD